MIPLLWNVGLEILPVSVCSNISLHFSIWKAHIKYSYFSSMLGCICIETCSSEEQDP